MSIATGLGPWQPQPSLHCFPLLHSRGELMKMTYLQYFLDVVHYGSISKAAEAHYLNQSNLSKYMKAVEAYFDATLFIRTCKGVELTPEGQQVFLWAEQTLREQQALKDSFSRQKIAADALSGKLTIFLSPSINTSLYAQMLTPFTQQYPQVQLHSHEKNIAAILELVPQTPDALGVTILDEKHLSCAARRDSLLVLPVAEKIRFLAFTAKNSRFAQAHRSIGLKALMKLPILLYSPSQECLSPIVEILSHYGELNITQETSNLSLFHSLLQTGQYVAIGINSTYSMAEYDTIAIRDKIDLSSCLLVQQNAARTPIIRTFIQFYYAQRQLPCPEIITKP